MIMTEIWKDIKGYEGRYQVSNLGKVRSLDTTDSLGRFHRGRLLRDCDNGNGYRVVNLRNKGQQKMFSVHRLVMTTFCPNEDTRLEINHIDGNKSNNRLDNLEWCTAHENMVHAVKNGLHNYFGQRKVRCVELGLVFDTIKEAEAWVGVKGSRISNVCQLKRGCKTCGGYHWEYVGEKRWKV